MGNESVAWMPALQDCSSSASPTKARNPAAPSAAATRRSKPSRIRVESPAARASRRATGRRRDIGIPMDCSPSEPERSVNVWRHIGKPGLWPRPGDAPVAVDHRFSDSPGLRAPATKRLQRAGCSPRHAIRHHRRPATPKFAEDAFETYADPLPPIRSAWLGSALALRRLRWRADCRWCPAGAA